MVYSRAGQCSSRRVHALQPATCTPGGRCVNATHCAQATAAMHRQPVPPPHAPPRCIKQGVALPPSAASARSTAVVAAGLALPAGSVLVLQRTGTPERALSSTSALAHRCVDPGRPCVLPYLMVAKSMGYTRNSAAAPPRKPASRCTAAARGRCSPCAS